MPKNKRSKVVKTAKTAKKTSEHKESLVNKIHLNMEKHEYVYLFDHDNMTTVPFRAIQEHLKDSKFFLGKNKVMQIALGRTEEDSYKENSYKIAEGLSGECGLLFTNEKPEDIIKFFDELNIEEFSKAGTIASKTIILNKGTEALAKFSHAIEPYLRKLGLVTSLNMGVITLQQDFVLSQAGQPLNPEQCKILKLMNIKMAQFEIKIKAHLSSQGSFKRYI